MLNGTNVRCTYIYLTCSYTAHMAGSFITYTKERTMPEKDDAGSIVL
jgi:hypothetical protein